MDFLLHFDLIAFIKTIGLIGLFLVVYSESGLLIGLFFPGDSLLFTAGLLSSQGYFNFALLVILTFLGALLGNMTGYHIGLRFGAKVFSSERSRFFKKEHLEKTETFFKKHGSQAVLFSRFFPFIRTITPLFAGVGRMPYRPFLFHSFTGAVFWAVCIPLIGYTLGSLIPSIDRYLLPIIAGILFMSLLPTLLHMRKEKVPQKI